MKSDYGSCAMANTRRVLLYGSMSRPRVEVGEHKKKKIARNKIYIYISYFELFTSVVMQLDTLMTFNVDPFVTNYTSDPHSIEYGMLTRNKTFIQVLLHTRVNFPFMYTQLFPFYVQN